MEVTEVFMTFAITSGIGLILAIGKLCYKSKCREVNVCCVKIVRDVEGEEKIDIELPTTPREGSQS
jgi:hypothetical protein